MTKTPNLQDGQNDFGPLPFMQIIPPHAPHGVARPDISPPAALSNECQGPPGPGNGEINGC